MYAAIRKLLNSTAALLLVVSLSGLLPTAQAQHLVHSRNHPPGEEGPPGEAEKVEKDSDSATLYKRIRHSRLRSKSHHHALPALPRLIPVSHLAFSPRGMDATPHPTSFAILTPLRC